MEEKYRDKTFSAQLIRWHKNYGRHSLPWQNTKNPYLVWVSEIMLQQTQVITVIPYYNKFIKKFPSIKSLAMTSEDQVLAYWSGLGFYSRARNLHRSAQLLLNENSGNFPNTYEEIIKLPGIGRSTAGAILAFCFDKNYPILDGNVKRLLSRYFGIIIPINTSEGEKKLWELSKNNLPDQEISIYTQSVMDFGSTICLPKKPSCHICPLMKLCSAQRKNLIDKIPIKKSLKKKDTKKTHFFIYEFKKQIFLIKNRSSVWRGLWVPPNEEQHQDLNGNIQKNGERQCTFSHYKLIFKYTLISFDQKPLLKLNGIWYHSKEINDLGLPAPIKRLLIDLSY